MQNENWEWELSRLPARRDRQLRFVVMVRALTAAPTCKEFARPAQKNNSHCQVWHITSQSWSAAPGANAKASKSRDSFSPVFSNGSPSKRSCSICSNTIFQL